MHFMTYLFLALFFPAFLFCGCGDSSSRFVPKSVSGEVRFENYRTGAVYVLAIKAEKNQSGNFDIGATKQKIREIETEPFPAASSRVAGCTRLDRPAKYRIEGLYGDYVIWAWVDVNNDGGVNHADYAEATGWYQTTEQLYPTMVSVRENNVSDIDIQLVSLTPYPSGDRSVAQGGGGGTLKTIKNQKILHLWGPAEGRGYAYGFLVGRQIIEWINYVVIEHYCGSADFYENVYLPFVRTQCLGSIPYYGQADAMLQGIRDSGVSINLRYLGRDITRDDIVGLNNLYLSSMIRLRRFWPLAALTPLVQQKSIACTSAVFWGDWTQNAELGRSLIHGKNNDGENDLRKITVNSLLIIATEPPAASGLRKVVGFDWPGFYGTCHGMNENGLVLAPHSATTMPDFDATNFLDYSTFYMETLQKSSSIGEVKSLWETATTTRTGGFNTAISVPYASAWVGSPSATYETDSFGGVMRLPGEITPGDLFSLLTTNDFYKYQGVNRKAVDFLHTYHATILPDDYRYQAMLDILSQYKTEGRTIGTPEMIEILRATANTRQYSGITEYSVICYPDTMSFALAKEDLSRKILSAPFATFTTFTFDEVFR
jgi:hypothetical protein